MLLEVGLYTIIEYYCIVSSKQEIVYHNLSFFQNDLSELNIVVHDVQSPFLPSL
jgi:hypothetical protein